MVHFYKVLSVAFLLSQSVSAHAAEPQTFYNPKYIEQDNEYWISAKSGAPFICEYLLNTTDLEVVGDPVIMELTVSGEDELMTALLFKNDLSPDVQVRKKTVKNNTAKVISEITCQIKE